MRRFACGLIVGALVCPLCIAVTNYLHHRSIIPT